MHLLFATRLRCIFSTIAAFNDTVKGHFFLTFKKPRYQFLITFKMISIISKEMFTKTLENWDLSRADKDWEDKNS